MSPTQTPIIIVPGLRGPVPQHWQTHLAAALPNARVLPFGRNQHDLHGRIADLHHLIEQADEPVTLIAHSAGCLTTVHWAAQHHLPIRGALLATPPDLANPLPPGHPTLDELTEHGWLPIPTTPLPFPSIIAASTNDPLSQPTNIQTLARAWGSHLINIGPVGHLNPASGHGPWPQAHHLINQLNQLTPHHTTHPAA